MMHGDSKALVNQGIAGTGAAVIYDNNHFNPVEYTAGLVKDMQIAKAKKELETKAANQKALEGLNIQPEGMYWRDEVLNAQNGVKDKWATPEMISVLSNPAHPLYSQFTKDKNGLGSMAALQKQLNTALSSDVAALRSNPDKWSPQSAELIKQATSLPLAEAYKLYEQNNGSLLKPQYHIEDLAEQISYVPQGVDFERKQGHIITKQVVDEPALMENIQGVLQRPDNAAVVQTLAADYGGIDKLAKAMRQTYKIDEPKVERIPQSTGGGSSTNVSSGSGFSNGDWSVGYAFDESVPFHKQGEVNVLPISYKGGTAKPSNYVEYENGNQKGTVYLTPQRIQKVMNDDGTATYELVGNETRRTGEKVSSESEAVAKFGANNFIIEQGQNGDTEFVKIEHLPNKSVPLNEANSAAFEAQTGMRIWDVINMANNKRGTNSDLSKRVNEKFVSRGVERTKANIISDIEAKISKLEEQLLSANEQQKPVIQNEINKQKELKAKTEKMEIKAGSGQTTNSWSKYKRG